MPGRKVGQYNFSHIGDSQAIGFTVSKDLYKRIVKLCDIVEMTQSSLCRYLLKRGVEQMEQRLAKMVEEERKKQAKSE